MLWEPKRVDPFWHTLSKRVNLVWPSMGIKLKEGIRFGWLCKSIFPSQLFMLPYQVLQLPSLIIIMNRLSVSGVGQSQGHILLWKCCIRPEKARYCWLPLSDLGLGPWQIAVCHKWRARRPWLCTILIFLFFLMNSCCWHQQESMLTGWHDADDTFSTITAVNGDFWRPLKTMKGASDFFHFQEITTRP